MPKMPGENEEDHEKLESG